MVKTRESDMSKMCRMSREESVGAGLCELDEEITELRKQVTPVTSPKQGNVTPDKDTVESLDKLIKRRSGILLPAPFHRGGLSKWDVVTAVVVLVMSSLIANVFYPPPSWATCDNSCAQAFDGKCDDGGVEGWPFDAQKSSGGGSCSLGSDCSDCGPRNFAVPKWFFILACLVTTALLLVGVGETARLLNDHLGGDLWTNVSTFTRIRVPLTDFPFGTAMVNRIANSTQVREKSLKCIQYILRGLAFSEKFSKEHSAQLKGLSKKISIARRFFKFLRWVKHFEDFEEAWEQKSMYMKCLLVFRIAANFGADWAEDVCSLERVGVLPEGTLSIRFMLFAEYCQLALALVEIMVTSVKVDKQLEITMLARDSIASEEKLLKQSRKLALLRLELVKYVSDVGKAIYDSELPYASERVFIGCSLFSGILSTHKNMVKILS